jgi:hypothetical protein
LVLPVRILSALVLVFADGGILVLVEMIVAMSVLSAPVASG